MKKIMLLLVVLVLSACSLQVEGEGKGNERFSTTSTNEFGLYIVKDKETNCKYLEYSEDRKGGITPLLKSDGTPDCD